MPDREKAAALGVDARDARAGGAADDRRARRRRVQGGGQPLRHPHAARAERPRDRRRRSSASTCARATASWSSCATWCASRPARRRRRSRAPTASAASRSRRTSTGKTLGDGDRGRARDRRGDPARGRARSRSPGNAEAIAERRAASSCIAIGLGDAGDLHGAGGAVRELRAPAHGDAGAAARDGRARSAALLLFGQTLNLFSMIGIMLLFGLVTKNSILLVDYANQLRARGHGQGARRCAPPRRCACARC